MKPVLLLIPGMLCDERIWQAVSPLVGEDVDLRIADVSVGATISALAEAAWDAISDVGPQRPVFLAGFSLGGYVAIEMVVHQKRPVAGVALISTSARPETAEGRQIREKTNAAMRTNFSKVIDGLVQWGMYQPPEPVATGFRAMCQEQGSEVGVRQNAAIAQRADHRAALGRLSLPVILLCGQQDKITPPELTEEMMRLIPSAQYHLIEDAGHMLPLEQPEAVAGIVRPWLLDLLYFKETK